MYDAFLGLSHRPFVAVPDVEQYYPATAIETARKTLMRSIDRGEGVGLLMGPAGSGKTLLLAMLAEQFRQKYVVAMLASGRLSTRRALFQAILHELGRPYRGMDEGELRLALCDHLLDAEACPFGMLLLVDEAHTLSFRLLDEIRMLTNLARRGSPLVQLILAGSCALEERFASPKLDSFNQRIIARCYLESLSRAETVQYIQSRIDAAGGNGKAVFPTETCQSVHKATDGVPRLVNQVCDHAIVLACTRAQKAVGTALIDESWADLQQLPTPWNENPAAEGESEGLIEFGSLGEESELEADFADEEDGSSTSSVLEFGELDDEDRLSPMVAQAATPEEQVSQIERMIFEVEEDPDFQPAGATTPEVELVFDDADHPFQEAFEEEELVTDRYLGRKAPAHGHGGVFDRVIASTSAPVAPMALPPKPKAVLLPEPPVTPPPVIAQELPKTVELRQTAEPVQTAKLSADSDRDVSPSQDVLLPKMVELSCEPENQPRLAESEHAVVMPLSRPVESHEEDDGVLVVEADYDESAGEPTTYKLAPVRRQEYSQLFARLRRKSV